MMRPINDEEAFQASVPTPLLDAAAGKDAAIQRAIAEVHSPPVEVEDSQAIRSEPITEPESSSSESAKVDRQVEPATFTPPMPSDVLPEAPPIEQIGVVTIPDDGTLWEYVLSALAGASEQLPIPMPAPSPMELAQTTRDEPSLKIADMRVCRRVLGFGRTEGLTTGTVEPSQAFLLYCEVDGLRDEETSEGFRSRLGATVAITAEGATTPAWSGELAIAEDVCRNRRRDYFVCYRLSVPSDLPAGTYQVRITSKDLLASRETSRSVELIVRSK